MRTAAELSTHTSGTSSSKDTSSSGHGCAPVDRCFQQGCPAFYLHGKCESPECRQLHDLTPQEKAMFLSWVGTDKQHVLFTTSSSGTDSRSNSADSTGGPLGNDRGGSASSSTALVTRPTLLQDIDVDTESSYRQLIVMIMDKCKGQTDEELKEQVPRDDDGNYLSLGSILHDIGKCSPCVYTEMREPCKDGLHCRFCHFGHKRAGGRRPKLRPCKGKRNRYRKLVNRLTESVQADPESFDAKELELPSSIESNSMLKNKLQKRMSSLAERICLEKEVGSDVAQGGASSSAGPSLASLSGTAAKRLGRNILSL